MQMQIETFNHMHYLPPHQVMTSRLAFVLSTLSLFQQRPHVLDPHHSLLQPLQPPTLLLISLLAVIALVFGGVLTSLVD